MKVGRRKEQVSKLAGADSMNMEVSIGQSHSRNLGANDAGLSIAS